MGGTGCSQVVLVVQETQNGETRRAERVGDSDGETAYWQQVCETADRENMDWA